MKIGLFFGSFNPIHCGHVALAEHFVQCGLDEVWLVVSPQNPLKAASQLWDDRFRLHLAQLALQDKPHLRVCDVEFSLPKPNYTINTLRALQAQHPEHSFVLLIGADNAASFDRWRDYQTILRDFEVWCYPRTGFSLDSERFPQIRAVDAPLYDISATEVRQRLATGQSIHSLVPECVEKEIAEFVRKKSL